MGTDSEVSGLSLNDCHSEDPQPPFKALLISVQFGNILSFLGSPLQSHTEAGGACEEGWGVLVCQPLLLHGQGSGNEACQAPTSAFQSDSCKFQNSTRAGMILTIS